MLLGAALVLAALTAVQAESIPPKGGVSDLHFLSLNP